VEEQYNDSDSDAPELTAKKQAIIDRKVEKYNSMSRNSTLHNTFLNQDYFGQNVMLTFRGRPTINTEVGASVSLFLRLVFILYALYLGSKMAVYDLDTRTQQWTKLDLLTLGV
jgi:hypothetical protein